MTSTGEVFPSSGTSTSEAPWSDNTWTTPGNVTADDASNASVTATSYDTGDQTFVLKAFGFDFSSIPAGSTINGITVRINCWRTAGTAEVDLVQLLDASRAKVGTNKAATPIVMQTDTATIITLGGASDLWGNALTSAWVKDPDFGVAIGVLATAENTDVFVDYVTIEIDYTEPGPISFSDDFNRSDSDTVGSPWVERAGDWDISNNGVIQTDALSGPGMLLYDQEVGDSHRAEITLAQSNGTGQVGIILRAHATAFTGLLIGIVDGAFKVLEITNGEGNTVSTGSGAGHTTGQRFRAESEGTTVRLFVDDVQVHTFTSSFALGNTRVGFFLEDSASGAIRFDDFYVDNFIESGTPEGSASGAIAWAGSVDGEMSPEATASGAIAWVGSVDGEMLPDGSVSGAIVWAGSANGQTPVDEFGGSASGTITWDGSAIGEMSPEGSASGAISWAGSVDVEMSPEGSASGAISWAGSVDAKMSPEGSVSGSILWAGSVDGETPLEGVGGSASGAISWAGSVTGKMLPEGSASGAVLWSGSVDGEMVPRGQVLGAIVWAGSAIAWVLIDPEIFLHKPHVTGHKPKVISSRKPRIVDGYKPVVTSGKDGG